MKAAKSNTALVIIDAQEGFHSPFWGKRNNPDAEENIKLLLSHFRKSHLPIVHIQHLSKDRKSPLWPGQSGADFIDGIEPKFGERVFQKTVNSAFIGTGLEKFLRRQKSNFLVMAGFTTDHCVSTSTRMASNLGFKVAIISDAMVAFERKLDGKIYDARLVHSVSLASLSREFAIVKDTKSLISEPFSWV